MTENPGPAHQSVLDAFLPPDVDDNGYLTEEWLGSLRLVNPDARGAAWIVMNLVPVCAAAMIYPSCETRGGMLEFHTGGWSGAEEFIEVLLAKFWVNHLLVKWERGGHYYFEITEDVT